MSTLRTITAGLTPDKPIVLFDPEPEIDSFTFGFTLTEFDTDREQWERWLDQFGPDKLEEFACHSAACRPPTSGGTGGSIAGPATAGSRGKTSSGAVESTDSDLDLLFPGRRSAGNKTVNDDGTFSVEGLDSKGRPIKFSDATEAKVKATWDELGPTPEQYVANFVIGGKIAMGIDPATGKVNKEAAAQGHQDAKWYTVAHNDCQDITKATGIPLDNVVAATAALSAGRLWSGTANGNIETARALADIVKNPREIEVTQAAIDLMDWRAAKSTKGVGKVGLTNHGLTPGKINSNELDSGTLVEVMYALNTVRGHSSLADWQAKTTANGKPGMKSSREQIDTPPPYPYFTSKGTQQVKQAVAVLREEVTPRQSISGPKYSSFYSNIRNPDADYSSTNDTWHYRIMAGNLDLTHTAKGKTTTDKIDRLTMKERAEGGVAPATAQDLFQRGPASKKEGLASGDVMFRDTTMLTRRALDQLKTEHPEQFKDMKAHEFQALIWVAYGGGRAKKSERLTMWDNARAAMAKAGF